MLTTGEVAKLFQVSAQTVINWLDQGRMPFERIGRGPRRLTEESVLNYIKEIGISTSALDQAIFSKAQKSVFASSNQSSDSVAIINSDLVVIAWNEGVKAITGLSPLDVLGKQYQELAFVQNGGEHKLQEELESQWAGPCININVDHHSSEKKLLSVSLTASKYYTDNQVAGYALVYTNQNGTIRV